jgi:hypothetical protein
VGVKAREVGQMTTGRDELTNAADVGALVVVVDLDATEFGGAVVEVDEDT